MTFEEAGKILADRQNFVKKNGLARVFACLSRLGDPHEKIKTIHVTGTNGKGSVCALFDSVLRSAGYKTGLFISPHLISLTERICVSGSEISQEEFAGAFEEVFKAGPNLSFFELLTCMAFLYFERAGTEIAVIEVGIGGRYDTTNVLARPELSVITSVDYDHEKYLGGTIAEIAGQKAGIIKKGCVCLAALLPEEARGPVMKEAQEKPAPVHFMASAFDITGYDWKSGMMTLKNKKTGTVFKLGIIGATQNSNATLVYEGVGILNSAGFKISQEHIAEGFARVNWPGRFQIVSASRPGTHLAARCVPYILDGAHNVEAVRSFTRTFEASPFKTADTAFVIGILNDKNYAAILRLLAPYAARAVFTMPQSERAVSPYALADEFSKIRPDAEIEAQEDIEAALVSAGRSGVVAVLGSFYLVGSALEILKQRRIVGGVDV
ncbi:MAG: bifunctional folylpolyglutamate synthase/dihydrofolate synthase [Elusimicrobia bacterium]|nr:bifunctional folylpolyglutamate synthase/dihydrofolate synthase [Elusimicrobiota bacterium]